MVCHASNKKPNRMFFIVTFFMYLCSAFRGHTMLALWVLYALTNNK